MREFGVSRLVLLSTVSVLAPQDNFSVVREGLVNGIKLIGYTAWTGDHFNLIHVSAAP
jgi:hypothetical protein